MVGTNLLEQRTIQSVKNPNQSPLTTCRCQQPPILAKSKAHQPGVMSHHKLSPLRPVMLNPHLPLLQTRTNQHHPTRNMRNLTQSFRITNGFNLMQELQVSKIINVNLLQKYRHNAVSAQPHRLDLRAEGEITDAAGLVVVPDHDFINGVLRLGTAADQGKDVATKKHLNDTDSAGVKFAAKDFAEGVAVKDSKAVVGAGGEAAGVLVEGEVEKGWSSGLRVLVRVCRGGLVVVVVGGVIRVGLGGLRWWWRHVG